MNYSKQTQDILISMYNGTTATLDRFDVYTQHNLFEDGYLCYKLPKDGFVYLSDAGIAYVESLLASQADKKAQIRHDWAIAIFSTIAGGVAGLITSLLFWLITA